MRRVSTVSGWDVPERSEGRGRSAFRATLPRAGVGMPSSQRQPAGGVKLARRRNTPTR